MNRIKAMCDLDVEIARKMTDGDYTDSQILAGLHKSRIEMRGVFKEITADMVIESRKFLDGIGMQHEILHREN